MSKKVLSEKTLRLSQAAASESNPQDDDGNKKKRKWIECAKYEAMAKERWEPGGLTTRNVTMHEQVLLARAFKKKQRNTPREDMICIMVDDENDYEDDLEALPETLGTENLKREQIRRFEASLKLRSEAVLIE